MQSNTSTKDTFMRMTFALAALAPAALMLSACGDSAADDENMDIETAPAEVPAEYPSVVTNARSTLEYAGTYEQRSSDGRIRTVTLGANDTYKMTDIEGVETTGTYNWYSDNSRILIKEGDETMVFAIADGTIYQMANAEAPINGTFSEDQAYRKSIQIDY